MSITERSAERARELRERLREEYGEFRTVEREWRHPPHLYGEMVDRFEDGHGGGAGAWVADDGGRVLLVRQRGGPGWSDPGTKRDPEESFEETARRAVREAADVEVELAGVLEFHEVSVYDGTDPDRPTLVEPIVVFAAQAGESPEALPDSEDVGWFEEHPPAVQYENVDERPIPFDPGS